jgi:hypothetical protein
MREADRRVRQAAQDASGGGMHERDDMVWDGDMLVPRPYESPLDKETLDERHAKGMGPSWEERRE